MNPGSTLGSTTGFCTDLGGLEMHLDYADGASSFDQCLSVANDNPDCNVAVYDVEFEVCYLYKYVGIPGNCDQENYSGAYLQQAAGNMEPS